MEYTMSKTTVYTVPTDTEHYGSNCIDGHACADAIIEHLLEYAKERGWNVEFRKVAETGSYGNRSSGDKAMIQELEYYDERNWIEWCPLDAYEN